MKTVSNRIKIMSGGQSGVDRAALDFALQNDFPCGGWCPKDRWAEDGKIPDQYPLRETSSSDPEARTKKNVDSNDGTLIIFIREMDEGTAFTLQYVKEKNKPLFIISKNNAGNAITFRNWMQEKKISILNIAGPRESNESGAYYFTLKVLKKLFE